MTKKNFNLTAMVCHRPRLNPRSVAHRTTSLKSGVFVFLKKGEEPNNLSQISPLISFIDSKLRLVDLKSLYIDPKGKVEENCGIFAYLAK
jgi:hypothetical protein